jgi:hypothetical protein
VTYKLNLIENGIDFIKSGIEIYFIDDTPDPRAHKYAILHLFSGMLLLLKERLARIRPALVFEDESQCGLPVAKTTSYHKTIGRLEANGVKSDPRKRIILDEIRDLRNAIEHYEVHLTLERTKQVISELTAFIYIFCLDELKFNVDERLSERALSRFYNLKEIGDVLYEDALASANADAEADDAYFQALEDKYAAMRVDELVAFTDVKRGGAEEAIQCVECPTCRETTLLLLEVGVCTNPQCRALHRLGLCHYCQGIAFNGAYLCERCRYG